jgi:biotin synthase-related radical SAM superfamily protein
MEIDALNAQYNSLLQYQRDYVTIPEFDEQEVVQDLKDILEDVTQKAEDKLQEGITQAKESLDEKKDKTRAFLADYAGVQSKKSQWDIYMSVMTQSDVDSSDDGMINFLEELRDIQKQNNTVEAYALYAENALQGGRDERDHA